MYLPSSRDPKASTQPIFSIVSWRFYYFVHLIQQYTKRDLSFDADSIRGVTGAFRFWQRGNILPFTFSDCFTSPSTNTALWWPRGLRRPWRGTMWVARSPVGEPAFQVGLGQTRPAPFVG